MDKIGDFILTLLHSVTNTHILHWQASTLSQHLALGKFYDVMNDKIDFLVETMVGKYETMIEFPVTYHGPAATGLEELQTLSKYFEEGRKDLPQDSEVQNICDEIQQLIDQTIYKLKFLK